MVGSDVNVNVGPLLASEVAVVLLVPDGDCCSAVGNDMKVNTVVRPDWDVVAVLPVWAAKLLVSKCISS